jgi:hypothetical protein
LKWEFRGLIFSIPFFCVIFGLSDVPLTCLLDRHNLLV